MAISCSRQLSFRRTKLSCDGQSHFGMPFQETAIMLWQEHGSELLREVCRLLSDTLRKCVVVVDTTSELGGFGLKAHPALGTEYLGT